MNDNETIRLNLHEALALYGPELSGIPAVELLKTLFRLRDSVCARIVLRYGQGLQGLVHGAALADFLALGCTKLQAERILMAIAIGRKLSVPTDQRVSITSPADVVATMAPILLGKLQEEFWVLNLNAKNKLLAKHMVSKGLVDRSPVHAREVFRQAISQSASRMILVHNHPSGDPTPSANDLATTRLLVEAGRVVGIEVTDHIVIGFPDGNQPGYSSFRELGFLKEEG